MILTTAQPKHADLKALIYEVPQFPITIRRLLRVARQKRAKPEVINFFKDFPDDQAFFDRDDILARTEQVEILRGEDAPEEFLRGFED